MAVLGDIEFVAPISQTGRDEAGAAVAQGIAGIAAIIGEEKEQDILGNLRGDLRADIESQVNENPVDKGSTPFQDPAVRAFSDDIRALTNRVNNGTRDQQSLAKLKMQRTLGEYRTRYPRLATQLQSQYNMAIGTDDKFTQLGIDAAQARQTSITSSRQLQDQTDYAYKSWVDGGLGISRTLKPTSDIFSLEFVRLDNLRQGIEKTAQNASRITNNINATMQQREAAWQSQLYGIYAEGYDIVMVGVEEAIRISKLRGDIDNKESVAQVQFYEATTRDLTLKNADITIAAVEKKFLADMPFRSQDTAEYGRIEKAKNDYIAHLERLKEALLSKNPTAIELWETEKLVRTIKMRNDYPRLDGILNVLELIKPVIPYLEINGIRDVVIKSDVGEAIGTGIKDILPLMQGVSSQGFETDVSPGPVTAEDWNLSQAQSHDIFDRPGGVVTTDPRSKKQGYIHTLKEAENFISAMVSEGIAKSSPKGVEQAYNLVSGTLRGMTMDGTTVIEEVEASDAYILDDQFVKAVDIMGSTSTIMRHTANMMENLYKQYNNGESGRRDELNALISTGAEPKAGASVVVTDLPVPTSYLEWDLSKVDEGKPRIVVNDPLFHAAHADSTYKLTAASQSQLVDRPVSQQAKNRVMRSIRERAQEIADELTLAVQRDTKVRGNMLYAQSLGAGGEPDYVRAYESLRYIEEEGLNIPLTAEQQAQMDEFLK